VGITFVHVTHDQEEAMTMADTIAVMIDGQVEQAGSPVELYERPATAFVANFLGQSNLLPGKVVDRAGADLVVDAGGRRLRLADAGAWSVGDRLQVGVRPEKIRLAGGGGNELDGVIRDVSFVGVSSQFVVDIPGGHEVAVFAQNLGLDGRWRPGERVTLSWDPQHTFAVAPAPGPVGGADQPSPEAPSTPTPGSVADTVAGTVER
jgi:spermidine/putrescine transport system ATP-binding protein